MATKNLLSKFTNAELRAELNRRETESIELLRDRKPRRFYRYIDTVKTLKELNSILKEYNDEQKDSALYIDGELYILDYETDEELKTRLSRTASVKWAYDHWRLELYEDGEHVGGQGQDSDYDGRKNEWESIVPEDDDEGEDAVGWNLEKAEIYRGYSAKPADQYQY